MKAIQSLVVAAAVALPAMSFAQSNQALTRADAHAQLVELQQAGYNPASDQTRYPENIEAAQVRVDAQKGWASSYGSSTAGTSASGSARRGETDIIGLGPIYANP